MKDPRALLLVQARMESARLPGKMLLPLAGQPMVLHVLDRLSRCQRTTYPILLSAHTDENYNLVQVAHNHGHAAGRPVCDSDDVLSRFWIGHHTYATEPGIPIVRVTGDCPLIDPDVIDSLVSAFMSSNYDYMSLGPSWPDGLDVEIFTWEALNTAFIATQGNDREHVTPYIYKSSLFRCGQLDCPFDLTNQRWCVDNMHDYLFVSRVFDLLFPRKPEFGWRDVWATVLEYNLDLAYPNREKRNEGYLKQAGITVTWEEFRFNM